MFKAVYFYQLTYLKASKTGVSKYIRSAPGLALQETLKKRKVELELLTSIDMFLMIGKGIKGGIGHTIHRYAEDNRKYKKYL